MKKYLPTWINNLSVNKKSSNFGFTLIELLVVISIIAILAVIGLALFANAQRNARDGIRRTEINNLAKSIESSKDITLANYTYTQSNYDGDYPNNKPRDPLKSASRPRYYLATSTTATPGNPTTWNDDGVTPTGPAGVTWTLFIDENSVISLGGLSSGARYWKICSRLEISGTPFCLGNLQ